MMENAYEPMASSPATLGELLRRLPDIPDHHDPASPVYADLARFARTEVERRFGPQADTAGEQLGPFGRIYLPYTRMGAIDSVDLFGLDELIIFAFYWANRSLYNNVADLGANLGLHSIVLDRCDFQVRSFEPDPQHFALLERNLRLNGCKSVEPHQAAISVSGGELEFVRVLGNTTGSHVAGAKPSPYGDLERFSVSATAFRDVLAWADLVKMDVEGHEAAILTDTSPEDWAGTDCLVEIGTAENAEVVFRHFVATDVGLYAQRLGWAPVGRLEDMPTSYRDGSLFITRRAEMPWPRVTEQGRAI